MLNLIAQDYSYAYHLLLTLNGYADRRVSGVIALTNVNLESIESTNGDTVGGQTRETIVGWKSS